MYYSVGVVIVIVIAVAAVAAFAVSGSSILASDNT